MNNCFKLEDTDDRTNEDCNAKYVSQEIINILLSNRDHLIPKQYIHKESFKQNFEWKDLIWKPKLK